MGRFLAIAALASLLGACAPALQVKKIDAAQEKPANVLVFFRVAAGSDPVPGLAESSFAVKEDQSVVGAGVDRVLVNPDLRAQEATIVLVDLGGRPTSTELTAMGTAVSTLVSRLGASKRLGILGVDGEEQPVVLAPVGATMDQLRDAASRIPQAKTRDPSLDLMSGYVAALRALEKALPPSNGPRIGNLVVLTRSMDRAARVTPSQVALELQKTTIDVGRYAIAFAPDAASMKLGLYTDATPIPVATPSALQDAASAVAGAIDARGRSFYLLSYCSASRAGEHQLRIDVSRDVTGGNGRKETQTGTLVHTFKADGFGPGCTPSVPDGWKPDPESHAVLLTQSRHGVAGAKSRASLTARESGRAPRSLRRSRRRRRVAGRGRVRQPCRVNLAPCRRLRSRSRLACGSRGSASSACCSTARSPATCGRCARRGCPRALRRKRRSLRPSFRPRRRPTPRCSSSRSSSAKGGSSTSSSRTSRRSPTPTSAPPRAWCTKGVAGRCARTRRSRRS